MFKALDRIIQNAGAMSVNRAILLGFTWIFMRIFFEGVLEATHRIGFSTFSYKMLLTYFVHFPLFYLSLFLLLVIVISALARERIKQVTKVASVGLASILFVPVIDWVLNRGYMITYPLRLGPYFVNFLNPLVSLADIGVSPGQRITIVLISLLVALYVYVRTRALPRALFSLLASLGVIVTFGALTTLFAANHPERVFISGGILYSETQKYCALYALILVVLISGYLYMHGAEWIRMIFRSLRLERVLFYGSLAIFGFAISLAQKNVAFEVDIFNYLGTVIMFLSMALGFWGLQVFNDLFDVDIDRAVGKINPLLDGVRVENYRSFSILLFMLALCCSLIINFTAFLIVGTFLLLGVVYSMPPVRVKQVPVVSTLVIAIAVVLSVALGFSVYYGARAISAIPVSILFPTVIAVTLGFVAKDIGHVKGDRARGVLTLPVLLYDDKSFPGRLPVAIIVSASYLVYAAFLPGLLLGAVICALCTFSYILFVKKSAEWFYFVMLYAFGGYLLFNYLRMSY